LPNVSFVPFALGSIAMSATLVCGSREAFAQEPPIDHALAKQYFTEANPISDEDNGALWKVPLCGPILFVDLGTRQGVANQADQEGKPGPVDGVFAGTVSA
jgi:hypothetical protein